MWSTRVGVQICNLVAISAGYGFLFDLPRFVAGREQAIAEQQVVVRIGLGLVVALVYAGDELLAD